MTCKDCIGYKFCSRGRNGQTNFYGKENACNNVEYLCHAFTNKSDYVEVKHGKWIHHYDDLFPAESTQECSVCHEEHFETGLCDDNFCPNCGAKMDKEG